MHTERVYDVGTDEKKSLKELLKRDVSEVLVHDSNADKVIDKILPPSKRPPNRTQKRKMEKDARRAKSKVDA